MNRLKSTGITVLVLLSALLISCSRVRRPVPGETENSGKGSDTAMTFTVTDGKYGAKGDGSADCTDAFLAASADAAESGGAVCIPAGTYRVGGKVEFPGNITLKFGRGAVIETAKGGAVTLDCRIEAAAMQIFGGEGTFSGNSRSTGYPEWFGGAADGGKRCVQTRRHKDNETYGDKRSRGAQGRDHSKKRHEPVRDSKRKRFLQQPFGYRERQPGVCGLFP